MNRPDPADQGHSHRLPTRKQPSARGRGWWGNQVEPQIKTPAPLRPGVRAEWPPLQVASSDPCLPVVQPSKGPAHSAAELVPVTSGIWPKQKHATSKLRLQGNPWLPVGSHAHTCDHVHFLSPFLQPPPPDPSQWGGGDKPPLHTTLGEHSISPQRPMWQELVSLANSWCLGTINKHATPAPVEPSD